MSNESSYTLAHAQIDAYQVGDQISVGPFGPVYDAVNVGTGSRVWLYALSSPDDQPLSPERLKHAMSSLRGLESPHLIQIDGYGRVEERDVSYVAYNAQGLTPLKQATPWLSSGGALQAGPEAIESVRRWSAEFLGALQALHAKRATHLALSDEALWLSSEQGLVVSHLGLATAFKRRVSSLASSGGLLHDPLLQARASYASPEEVKGRLTQPVADLYAVACLLCEWLTGAPPFSAPTPSELLSQQLSLDPSESSTLSSLPEPLRAVFMKALNKEPRGRFNTARELLDAFHNALDLSLGDPQGDTSLQGLDSLDLTAADFSVPQTEEEFEVGLSTVLDLDDEPEPEDELAFGFEGDEGGADEMAFGQVQSDERTFLEFSDVDDQTVFEADIQDEIEETHKSLVEEQHPVRSAEKRVSSLMESTPPPHEPLRTAAFASVDFEPAPAPAPAPLMAQTLGLASSVVPTVSEGSINNAAGEGEVDLSGLSEHFLGRLDDGPQDPSRVLPLPAAGLQAHTPTDDLGLEGAADLSSIQPAIDPRMYAHSAPQVTPPQVTPQPAQSSPFGAPPQAQNSPFGAPPQAQSSPFGAPPQAQSSPFGAPPQAQTQSTINITPPSKRTSGSANKKPLLIALALIMTLGGVGWGMMTGLINLSALSALGGGPVSLDISTQRSQEMGLVIQKTLRKQTPYKYTFTGGESVGDELALRFASKSLLLKTTTPVFEGSAWVTLLTEPPYGVQSQSDLERVIITSDQPQAKVSIGMEHLGFTPITLFGQRGQRLELVVETLGYDKRLNVTFGDKERVDVSFKEQMSGD